MLKRHMAVCLLATSLAGGAAFAQSTTAPSTAAPASGQFVTEQASTNWLSSKLIGVDVYGSDNAKIGDISEILVNKEGNAETVVIGVGGFLGIGQKNVAVPFKSVEWKDTPAPSASAAKTTSTDSTGSTSTTTAAPPATSSGSSAADAASRGYPDHAMIKATKEELQNAPAFRYASEARAASTTSAPTPPMGSTAPKQ